MRKVKVIKMRKRPPKNWNPGFMPTVPLREMFLILGRAKQMYLNGEIKSSEDYWRPKLEELKALYAGRKVYDI